MKYLYVYKVIDSIRVNNMCKYMICFYILFVYSISKVHMWVEISQNIWIMFIQHIRLSSIPIESMGRTVWYIHLHENNPSKINPTIPFVRLWDKTSRSVHGKNLPTFNLTNLHGNLQDESKGSQVGRWSTTFQGIQVWILRC